MFQNILIINNTESGFSFNPDILETNLINIIILVVGLFILGRDFLGTTLSSRQNLILNNIKNADDKLNQALERLQEAKIQASQEDLIYREISAQALKEKLASLEAGYATSQEKVIRQYEAAFTAMNSHKYKILNDIKIEIATNAIFSVIRDLETFSNEDHERLINERIKMIEGLL